jgi:hypothetical protein
MRIYMTEYKEKWERMVRKHERDVEINVIKVK